MIRLKCTKEQHVKKVVSIHKRIYNLFPVTQNSIKRFYLQQGIEIPFDMQDFFKYRWDHGYKFDLIGKNFIDKGMDLDQMLYQKEFKEFIINSK